MKPSLRRAPFVLAVAVLTLCGCRASAPATPPPQAAPAQAAAADTLSRAERWQQDLAFLADELPRRHKDLFVHLDSTAFQAAATAFEAQIPDFEDSKIIVEMMRLVAMAGDAHTGIRFGGTGFRRYPLGVFWFEDGLYVTQADSAHRQMLGGRIVSVGGMPIDEVIEQLQTVIAAENEMQFRQSVQRYLMTPEILAALGVVADSDGNVFTLDLGEGAPRPFAVTPVSKPFNALQVGPSEPDERPLYLRRTRAIYWHTFLPESRTMYVQYNQCRVDPALPMKRFAEQVFREADSLGAERMVIDLRLNSGGNSIIFRPFLQQLKSHRLNAEGRLFVLIGRRTFSSALLNALELQKQTEAVLAGEPTGGKPNHFGEVRTFQLPHSRLTIHYSTKYFTIVPGDPPSLEPDRRIPITFKDFEAGADPVLEAVLTGF